LEEEQKRLEDSEENGECVTIGGRASEDSDSESEDSVVFSPNRRFDEHNNEKSLPYLTQSQLEKYELHTPLRLRGGVRSISGSPTIRTDETLVNVSMELDALVASSEPISPRLLPIRNTDVDTDSELESRIGSRKRKKTTDELCAMNDVNPGLSDTRTLGITRKAQRLRTRLDTWAIVERDKKKISVASYQGLMEIKEEYYALVERLILENSILEGRLAEARVSHEALLIYHKSIVNSSDRDKVHQTPELQNKPIGQELERANRPEKKRKSR